jgi:hypothetical protein
MFEQNLKICHGWFFILNSRRIYSLVSAKGDLPFIPSIDGEYKAGLRQTLAIIDNHVPWEQIMLWLIRK